MLKLVNLAGGLALLLLGRKLVWCLYWLWCWRHGRETPPPIGWLPGRDGRRFDAMCRPAIRRHSHVLLEKERGPVGH